MLDSEEILVSIGAAAYEWRIDTDALVWGQNVGEVLGVGDAAALASERGYSRLIDADGGPTRRDAVMRAAVRDQGAGVPYLLQYALRLPADERRVQIEDSGRWFAGRDGKPIRAHGVIRVVNKRHEREQRLA